MQIALGGWTSSNYAALACPDLPTCQGSWWPQADFRSGYWLWRDIQAQGLIAIHLLHRLGAMVAGCGAVGGAAIAALASPRARAPVRRAALLVLAPLCLHAVDHSAWTMVLRGFPLWLATAHNAGAALLLLATLALSTSSPLPTRQTMSRTDAPAIALSRHLA